MNKNINFRASYLLYDYIVRSLIYPFVLGVMFITFILVMFQVLRLTNFAIVHGVSFFEVSRVLFYLLVSFLPVAIPISFLFSVLSVFGQMSTDNEIIALRTAGFSLTQLFVPVFLISILISIFSLRVSFYESPDAYINVKNILHKIGSKTVSLSVKPGFFNTEMIKDVVFYAEKIENNILEDVFIYDGRDIDMPTSVFAKKAILDIDDNTSRTIMKLFDGRAVFGEKKFSLMDFKEYNILLFAGTKLSGIREKLHYLNLDRLNNVLKKNPSHKAIMEYHKRWAMSLACIIFAFIGLLFGNFTGRTGRSVGLISFAFVLLYWIFYILGTSLGAKGVINPIIAAWLADIVFLTIGITYWRSKSFNL